MSSLKVRLYLAVIVSFTVLPVDTWKVVRYYLKGDVSQVQVNFSLILLQTDILSRRFKTLLSQKYPCILSNLMQIVWCHHHLNFATQTLMNKHARMTCVMHVVWLLQG